MSIEAAVDALRELNEPVSAPLRLPIKEEVIAVERELGITFPEDYCYFLLHGSDIVYGALEPAIVASDGGHLDLLKLVQTARKIGVPREFLPFCEDNGDYYCFAPDGHVLFWSHNGVSAETWFDLAQWIQEVWIGKR